METLAKGTIETLVTDMQDRLGNITDLTTHNPRFSIFKDDEAETAVVTDQAATVNPSNTMEVLSLLDTTTMDEGEYLLYLRFTVGGETPYLLVGKFRID